MTACDATAPSKRVPDISSALTVAGVCGAAHVSAKAMPKSMDKHSPLPWRLKELPTGDIEILDANGNLVHSNSMYYPTGISPADARLIIQSVNAGSKGR